MISLNRIRHRPASLGVVTQGKTCGAFLFDVVFLQAVNAGGDVDEYGAIFTNRRMPQLDSIPKAKRQAATQSTDHGTDDAKWRAKSKERAGNRSCNDGSVLVNLVPQNTKLANCVKRLIPCSKYSFSPRTLWVREGKPSCQKIYEKDANQEAEEASPIRATTRKPLQDLYEFSKVEGIQAEDFRRTGPHVRIVRIF